MAGKIQKINTKSYWDSRFLVDWERRKGREQSKFFCQLAIDNFPKWFTDRVKDGKLSLCDWGCALGDGTQLLLEKFPQNKIIGVDFSEEAIKKAKESFKGISFVAKDFLKDADNTSEYDILFSSNTLEHFNDAWNVFDKISKKARKYVVLLLPFRELDLIPEHFSSFNFSTTQYSRNGWTIVHSSVIDTTSIVQTHWYGEQILLIFAKDKEISDSKLMLSNLTIHTANNNPKEARIQEEKLNLEISENRRIVEKLKMEKQEMLDKISYFEIRKNILEQENDELNRKFVDISASFEKIISSKRWIIMNKIADKMARLFPANSLQRDCLRFCFQFFKLGFRILKGIKNRINNLYSYINSLFIIIRNHTFDAKYYQNHELRKKILFPKLHYLFRGYKDCLNPNEYFDSQYYELSYPDVRERKLNHLIHYIRSCDPNKELMVKFAKYMASKFDESKETLALQLESFDKGGLEEVVLSLATSEALQLKYNVVILVSGNKLGHIAELAQKRGIPVLALDGKEDLQDYLIAKLKIKICHLHYSLFGVARYHANGVKTVYTIHNNYIWGDEEFVRYRKEKYKLVDSFVAVSRQVGDYFSTKFEIPQSKIKVIPNGVDLATLDSFETMKREDLGLDSKDFVFINVSSFTGNKFHALMVVAMSKLVKKYPNMKLLLLGNVLEEKYYENIRRLIAKYNVENNVKIIDYVPKKKVLGLLKISNCFVLPSLTEGFSISTIEAMYSKLPMILSDVGGAREAIENNDLGIVIRNPYANILDLNIETINSKYLGDKNLTNLTALTNAMSDMYENRKEWKKKAELGMKKVKERFNIERVVKEYSDVFQDVAINDGYILLPTVAKGINVKKSDDEGIFKTKPLISVMLPVYNHADLVVSSIESVRQQTYRNWELIILDDGSKDNLLDILKKYSDDPRIRIFSQKNQKLPRALSHLHQLARGSLLTWTSSDNIMEPDMLNQLASFLLTNPECVLCYADVSLIDSQGKYYMKKDYCADLVDPEKPYIIRLPRDASALGAEAKNFINACFMYRKEGSDILGGGYAADLTGLEDYDFWLRLSRIGKIMHIHNQEPLYRYRVHKNSMSEELLTIKNVEHMKRLDKFIVFEHKRQAFADAGYNIQIGKGLDVSSLSRDIGSERSIYIHSINEDIKEKENVLPVGYDNAYYHVNLNNCRYVSVSSGYNINSLCSKTRYIQKALYKKEYSNLNGRPVIGIHFNTNNIDISKLRKAIETNPSIYFVICDTEDDGKGYEIVADLENTAFLGKQDFGVPYEIYASWNAVMIPPMITIKGVNLDAQKVLAWSCNKRLLVPMNIPSLEILPLILYYEEFTPIQIVDLLKLSLDDEYVLNRYLEAYSREGRLNYLINVINGLLQETSIDRPDFEEKPVSEEFPKIIKDQFYGMNGQDFKSEVDYWDTELSLNGTYPQAIVNRSTPDLMKAEYPEILDKYRKKLDGELKVLDVGSGPLSMLGYGHYNGLFELECVDPLGDVYNQLLKKYNFKINYKILTSPGESLSQVLKENSYDIVWMHNALDHSKDPAQVIVEMSKLLKKGGYLLILGWENEGSWENFYGLHQHDLYIKDKQLWLMNNIGFSRRIDNVSSLQMVESKQTHTTRTQFHIVYQKK